MPVFLFLQRLHWDHFCRKTAEGLFVIERTVSKQFRALCHRHKAGIANDQQMVRWTFAVSGALGLSLCSLFCGAGWRICQLRCPSYAKIRKLSVIRALLWTNHQNLVQLSIIQALLWTNHQNLVQLSLIRALLWTNHQNLVQLSVIRALLWTTS